VLRARTLPRRRGGGRGVACGSCTGGGTKARKHGSCVTMSPAALRGSRSGAPRTAWASPRFWPGGRVGRAKGRRHGARAGGQAV